MHHCSQFISNWHNINYYDNDDDDDDDDLACFSLFITIYQMTVPILYNKPW